MCQAIRDGGRRCPIHRHSSVALIKAAAAKSSVLNRTQVERLFAELRREGRTSVISNETYDLIIAEQSAIIQADTRLSDEQKEEIKAQFTLGRQHDEAPDSGTIYAFSTLMSRMRDRDNSLRSFFAETAERTGYTFEEVQEHFKTEYSSTPSGRGAETPAEYNQNTRRRAVLANLPYDRASVTAIEKLKAWNPNSDAETSRRVTLTEAGPGRTIESWGYHEGRLEIKFYGQNQIQAYHNVPTNVWENMQSARYPNSAYIQYIRNHDEYQYASQEAADNDATAYRCANCGQFRSQSQHLCPRMGDREQLVESGITMETATAELVDNREQDAALISEITSESGPLNIITVSSVPETLAAADKQALSFYENGIYEVIEEPADYDHPMFINREKLQEKIGDESTSLLNAMYSIDYYHTAMEYKNAMHVNADNYRSLYMEEHVEAELDKFFGDNDPNKVAVINRDDRTIEALFFRNAISIDEGDHYDSRVLYPIVASFSPTARSENSYDQDLEAFNATWGTETNPEVVYVESEQDITNLSDAGSGFSHQDASYMLLPKAQDMASALSAGKVVSMNTEIICNGWTRITSDGVQIGRSRGARNKVTGQVAIRMRQDGHIEYVGRALKCSCSKYREQYNCEHITTAMSNGLDILQRLSGVKIDLPGVTKIPEHFVPKISDEAYAYLTISSPSRRRTYNRTITKISQDDYKAEMEEFYNRILQAENSGGIAFEDITSDQREFIRYMSLRPGPEARYVRPSTHLTTNHCLSEAEKEAIAHSNTEIKVSASMDASMGYRIDGTIIYAAGSTPNDPRVLGNKLKCTCADYKEKYDCEHVRSIINNHAGQFLYNYQESSDIVNQEYDDEQRNYRQTAIDFQRNYSSVIEFEESVLRHQIHKGLNREDAEAAVLEFQRITKENQALEKAKYDSYRESRLQAWEETSPAIADDMESFKEHMNDLERRRIRGENLLEMQTENVTDGICAPGENTRSFGVELEFDIKSGVDEEEALEKIGIELYEAGLTTSSGQDEYHSSSGSWHNWSFEEDCTVAGEIVSPIMKDTPEHWEQLNKVIEIINRNGGVASTNAGCHVNISSGSYARSTAAHAELSRVTAMNEDTLFRLASSPSRGTHRGQEWCAPNISISDSNIDVEAFGSSRRHSTPTHGDVVNYDASIHEEDSSSARVEFRLWDATLNTAVIQQQVAISAALVDYAERKVILNGGYVVEDDVEKRTLGTAAKIAKENNEPKVSDMTEEQFHESHGHVAALFDNLFRTEEQRDRASRLYAMTNNVKED